MVNLLMMKTRQSASSHQMQQKKNTANPQIFCNGGFTMNKVYTLHDAVAKFVENGEVLAIGGITTNRKPYAIVNEILRQGQTDFVAYAGPGGGEIDMLIGEGRVAAYINCYTANSGYTNVARRFRAAIEKGQLNYEDYSQDVLMLMLHAIPSVIKSFVSDLGVSCLFLASMKR